jgi:hypothetical protein
MTNLYHLRADLAFIRSLIRLHCRAIDLLKQFERDTLAAIDAETGAEAGRVAAAVARVGERMWQWDGRLN